MKKGISEIVAHVDSTSGPKVAVYRALRPLICASCGSEISEGTLFTRHTMADQGVHLFPQCQACTPFTLPSSSQSKLIRSLLSSEPEKLVGQSQRAGKSTKQVSSPASHRKIMEAVQQRLGPALARTRRSRSGRG